MTLTTEQLRERAESLGISFFIEQRAGIWVKQWFNNGCTTAPPEEVMMWSMLVNREAQPVAVPDSLTYLREEIICNVLNDDDNSPMAHAARILAREVKFWRSQPLFTAPPAPAVSLSPDFEAWFNSHEAGLRVVNFHIQHELQLKSWNACCAAMLAASEVG